MVGYPGTPLGDGAHIGFSLFPKLGFSYARGFLWALEHTSTLILSFLLCKMRVVMLTTQGVLGASIETRYS